MIRSIRSWQTKNRFLSVYFVLYILVEDAITDIFLVKLLLLKMPGDYADISKYSPLAECTSLKIVY